MNMSYCRFSNTLTDFRDCVEHIRSLSPEDDSQNAIEERNARGALIQLAADLLAELGIEDSGDAHAIDAAIQELDAGGEDEE